MMAYSSLESRIDCSVCSGKGRKLATEYSIVRSLLLVRVNRTKYIRIQIQQAVKMAP